MKEIKDLESLLLYYAQQIYSAERQVQEVMPLIINKAKHAALKNALQHHHNLSTEQVKRLESVTEEVVERNTAEKKRKTRSDKFRLQDEPTCKGMEGIIEEIKSLLEIKLSKELTDAAIIGAVQKIEHYEICTYGTAVAYAAQAGLPAAETALKETLNEEYDIDDLLTTLAVTSLNKEAGGKEKEATTAKTGSAEAPVNKSHPEAGAVHITERNINSPGGRAGTSHRRYPNGESRGH